MPGLNDTGMTITIHNQYLIYTNTKLKGQLSTFHV